MNARNLSQYVYRLSRGLIGKELSDSLEFPSGSSFGVVGHFKMQERYEYILGKLLPGYAKKNNLNRFSSLLETSLFDEDGISYRLPDHVYAERSSRW